MTKKESSTVQKSRLKSNDKQLCWAKPCRSSMFAGKLEDEIIGLQSSLQVPGKEELSFANTVLFTLCFHLKRRDGRREGRDSLSPLKRCILDEQSECVQNLLPYAKLKGVHPNSQDPVLQT